MLSASAEDISEDLRRYGEPEAAEWMDRCSEDELVTVCSVADWLLLHGSTNPSGSSMMIAKACALAAVYVKEGAPRNLARSSRGKGSRVPEAPGGGRRPNYQLQVAAPRHYGVGDDARQFWSEA